jgi:hypothetical protein
VTEQEENAVSNSAVRCACGREELLTPANPQPGNAGGEDQSARYERPGPHSKDEAITAGPVRRRQEGN